MNQTIAKIGSFIAALAIITFAVCRLMEFDLASFFVCMLIALGFVMIIGGFHVESDTEHMVRKLPAGLNLGLPSFCDQQQK